MAEVEITHAFVSAKPDSPDPTLVSSSEWNEKLMIGGGANGQMMVRDSGQPHGARWTQAPQAYSAGGSGGGGSLTAPLAPITVTFAVASTVLLAVNVTLLSSAGQQASVTILRNGVVARTTSARGDNIATVARVDVFTELPGTVTYAVQVQTATGIITNVLIDNQLVVFGN